MNLIYFWFFLISSILAVPSKKNHRDRHDNTDNIVLSDIWKREPKVFENAPKLVVPIGKVPQYQFEASWGVQFPIFLFLASLNSDSIFYEILRAICCCFILSYIPVYFGYWSILTFSQIPGFSYLPTIKFTEIKYNPDNKFVSEDRWMAGPLFWLSEIIVLLPIDTYKYLESKFMFPSRMQFSFFFAILASHFFGLYEYFDTILDSFFDRLSRYSEQTKQNKQTEPINIF